MTIDDFSKRYLDPAMSVLAANIEADAMSMYKDIYQSSNQSTITATCSSLSICSAASRASRPGPRALIYFGGNAEETSWMLEAATAHSPGASWLIASYRGYGLSEGRPGEAALVADELGPG